MTQILIIALGGAIGAVLRHLTGKVAMRFFGASSIYTGTLFANLIGCFIGGGLLAYFSHVDSFIEETRLFLTIGILGSYTTFSSFAFETHQLFNISNKELFVYLFYQIAGAFSALAAGYGIVFWLMRTFTHA